MIVSKPTLEDNIYQACLHMADILHIHPLDTLEFIISALYDNTIDHYPFKTSRDVLRRSIHLKLWSNCDTHPYSISYPT